MSPLQRTISVPFLLACSIFLVVFFSACSDRIKTDIIAFKALDESLVNSNIVIYNQSLSELAILENKLTDPATVEKANIWYPKAQLIQKLSKEIYLYIEALKSDLKKEAGLNLEGEKKSFREGDKNAVVRLFSNQGKGEELYKQIANYKRNLLAVDSQILQEFGNTILLTTRTFDSDSSKNKQQSFTRNSFDDLPTIAALAILSKFQNNIKINENKTIIFCNNKVATRIYIHDIYTGFAMANSSYVKAGEKIEITAGVGAFSRWAMPEILINGKNVPLDTDGAAHYMFEAPDKPGKHVVTVVISFTDQEGKKQTIPKPIEYTVAN